jgi:hypothetical protein
MVAEAKATLCPHLSLLATRSVRHHVRTILTSHGLTRGLWFGFRHEWLCTRGSRPLRSLPTLNGVGGIVLPTVISAMLTERAALIIRYTSLRSLQSPMCMRLAMTWGIGAITGYL